MWRDVGCVQYLVVPRSESQVSLGVLHASSSDRHVLPLGGRDRVHVRIIHCNVAISSSFILFFIQVPIRDPIGWV